MTLDEFIVGLPFDLHDSTRALITGDQNVRLRKPGGRGKSVAASVMASYAVYRELARNRSFDAIMHGTWLCQNDPEHIVYDFELMLILFKDHPVFQRALEAELYTGSTLVDSKVDDKPTKDIHISRMRNPIILSAVAPTEHALRGHTRFLAVVDEYTGPSSVELALDHSMRTCGTDTTKILMSSV